MIKVIYAASWLAERRFCSFSHRLYAGNARWNEPDVWQGRKVLSPKHNELMRLPHILLMAVEDGKILARMLTGIAAGDQGYFALFDAEPNGEAVRVLMEAAEAWQRARGSRRLVGPIAPTMADIGGGVLHDGFEEPAAFCDAYHAEYYAGLLEQCGFEPCSEWLAYRIELSSFDRTRYRRAADWAKRRFGYEVEQGLSRGPRALAQTVCSVMEGEVAQEDANRLVGRIFPSLSPDFCPVAVRENHPVGFLLTLEKRGIRPRIVSLWVRKEWRGKGVTAALFDDLAQAAERRGIMSMDGSMIHSDNIASRLGAERAGGSVIHRYYQYWKWV